MGKIKAQTQSPSHRVQLVQYCRDARVGGEYSIDFANFLLINTNGKLHYAVEITLRKPTSILHMLCFRLHYPNAWCFLFVACSCWINRKNTVTARTFLISRENKLTYFFQKQKNITSLEKNIFRNSETVAIAKNSLVIVIRFFPAQVHNCLSRHKTRKVRTIKNISATRSRAATCEKK